MHLPRGLVTENGGSVTENVTHFKIFILLVSVFPLAGLGSPDSWGWRLIKGVAKPKLFRAEAYPAMHLLSFVGLFFAMSPSHLTFIRTLQVLPTFKESHFTRRESFNHILYSLTSLPPFIGRIMIIL